MMIEQAELKETTYPVTFASIQLRSKPKAQEANTFNRIHNELKNNESLELPLEEILHRAQRGQPFKNGIYEEDKSLTQAEKDELRDLKDTDIDKYLERSKSIQSKKEPVFKRTNWAILDIDDARGATNPEEVTETMGAMASYFSYSDKQEHLKNVPMRRYRQLYMLSETIESVVELEYIQEQIKLELIEIYPSLKDENIKNELGKTKSNGIDNIVNGFFYGTNKEAIINRKPTVINVKPYLKRYKEVEAEKELERELKALSGNFEIDVNEQGLNDMVEHIGGLNLNSYDEWFSMAVGVWHTAQLKGWNEENILRQLQLLDNDEHNLKYYYQYKLPTDTVDDPATIGTLFYHAKKLGYEVKPSENKGDTLTDNTTKEIKDVQKIERYIGKENMLNILNNPYKTSLIVSDTNTGKTRASIEASRAYLEAHKDTFIYIAVPTTAIAEQNAINHNVNRAIFGSVNVKPEINKAIRKDDRLLIGTYDKAPIIKDNLIDYEMIIIMDEAHKEVTDYSYRYKAITKLFELTESNQVTKFIGLTGTPYELNFDDYEHVKRFELEKPKVLADKLRFIEFTKVKEFDSIVLNQIQKNVQEGNKALVLLDNRDKTDYFQRTLKGVGIKASMVNANTKGSSSYKYLLEKESFREDIDVILATRAIADGININNKTNDYVTIIGSLYHGGNGTTEISNFYNLDLIRQTANRLRFKYKEIIIPLFVPERIGDSRKGSKAYDLERQYNYLLHEAKVVQTVIKHTYKGNIENLKYSTIETINGLSSKRYEEKQGTPFNFELSHEEYIKRENGLRCDYQIVKEYEEIRKSLLEIDKRMIRAQASRNKEDYYKYNPYAFKEALKATLDVDEVVENDSILEEINSEISKDLRKLRAYQKGNDEKKREHLREVLHEIRFNKIKERYHLKGRVDEDTEFMVEIKKAMNKVQYETLLNVIGYLDYEQTIEELEYVEELKHRKELGKSFKAIIERESFQDNNHVTARMYFDLLEGVEAWNAPLSASQKKILIEGIAKDFKFTNNASYKKLTDRQRDFKKLFNRFFVKGKESTATIKGKRTKVAQYEVISFEWLAGMRGVTIENILEKHNNYIYEFGL